MRKLRNIASYTLIVIFGVLLAHDLNHNHIHLCHTAMCTTAVSESAACDSGCHDHGTPVCSHDGGIVTVCGCHSGGSSECNIYPNYLPKQEEINAPAVELLYIIADIIKTPEPTLSVSGIYTPDDVSPSELWQGEPYSLRGPPSLV